MRLAFQSDLPACEVSCERGEPMNQPESSDAGSDWTCDHGLGFAGVVADEPLECGQRVPLNQVPAVLEQGDVSVGKRCAELE